MSRDAFISYARNPDEDFAPALHGGLQTLGKPWNKRRALDVFLDKAGLEASASLGDSLQRDLEGARYLVVLASTGLAGSHWCGEEIKHWLATTGSPDRLLLGLTDGEIGWNNETGDFDWNLTTALPQESMSGVFDNEPLWVDFRDVKQTDAGALDIRAHKGFEDLVATIGAPIHGLSKDELVGKDLKEFKKSQSLRRIAIISLTILTLVAAGLAIYARQQQNEAVAQRDEADRQRGVAEEQRGVAEEQRELALANEQTARANEAKAQREAREASSRELAAAASALLTEDPELGLMLALQSIAITADADGYVLYASQQALHDSVAASGVRQRFGTFAPWTVEEGYSYAGAVDFDPTGQFLAASLADGDIALFERLGDSAFQQVLQTDTGDTVTRIRPSAESSIVATQNEGVWDYETGEQLIEWADQAAVADDGSVIAVGLDGQIIELGPDGTSRPAPRHELDESRGDQGRVTDIAISPDQRRVAITDHLGRYFIWTRGQTRFSLAGEQRFEPCLAIVWLNNAEIAQGCGSGAIDIIDVDQGGEEIAVLTGHTAGIHRLDATSDGRWLVSGSADWTARVWDIEVLREVRQFAGHEAMVTDVATTPRGDLVATVAQDGTVVIWERETGELSWKLSEQTWLMDHTISFSSSGAVVTPAYDPISIGLAGAAIAAIEDPDVSTSQAMGDKIVLGDWFGEVWLAGDQPGAGEPPRHDNFVRDLATSGHHVVSVSSDSVWLWDTAGGGTQQLSTFDNEWTAADITADGTRVAMGGWFSVVQVLDTTDPDAPRVLFDQRIAEVTDIALHPTEPLLAVALADGAVQLWDYELGDEFTPRLAGHRDWVLSVAFSPDGTQLVTGGRDQTVRVWDVASREALLVFQSHDSAVTAVAYSEDGTLIASAGVNGRLLLHHVDIGELVELASTRFTRQFTDQECDLYFSDTCPTVAAPTVAGLPVVEELPED